MLINPQTLREASVREVDKTPPLPSKKIYKRNKKPIAGEFGKKTSAAHTTGGGARGQPARRRSSAPCVAWSSTRESACSASPRAATCTTKIASRPGWPRTSAAPSARLRSPPPPQPPPRPPRRRETLSFPSPLLIVSSSFPPLPLISSTSRDAYVYTGGKSKHAAGRARTLVASWLIRVFLK